MNEIRDSKILLVDDNPNNLKLIGNVLKANGFRIEFSISAENALKWLKKEQFDLILLDVNMPEMDGFEFCKIIKKDKDFSKTPIIFLTAKNDKEDILNGFRLGAQDYVLKPFDEEILLARVKTHILLQTMQKRMEELVLKRTNELEISQIELQKTLIKLEQLKDKLQDENTYMKEEILESNNFNNILGKSKSLKKTLSEVEKVSRSEANVLIFGKTGTGKELIARAIHENGSRNNQALIKVNCAAIPENLIESELFGHEKGAFTGAVATRKGKFELADSGTLFLDEIGELPLNLQPKLLRVLQEGEFERVGGSKQIKVNVRVISATNRDLINMIDSGLFRQDLFYRLSVYPIQLDPLRKRIEDIPVLTEFFISKYCKKLGIKEKKIGDKQLQILKEYSFPGNIRELENIIERAIISSNSNYINIEKTFFRTDKTQDLALKPLDEFEKDYILKVLETCDWAISGENGAAHILELHPNTLRSKMEKMGIKKNMKYK